MNISCELIKDLAQPYFGGRVSEKTAKLIEGHLEECDECRYFYSGRRSVKTPHFKVEFSEPEEEQIALNLSRLSKRLQIRRTIGTVLAVITAVLGLSALLYDLISEHKK